jgi:hypothetical protein
MDLWQSPQIEKARQLAYQLNKLLGVDNMYPLLLRVLKNKNGEDDNNMGPEVLLDNMESLIKGINDRTRYYKKLEEENVQLKLLLNTTLNIVNTLTIPELRSKQHQTLKEQNALTTKKILSLQNERREGPLISTHYSNDEDDDEDQSSNSDSDSSSYCTEEDEEESNEEYEEEEQPSHTVSFTQFRFPPPSYHSQDSISQNFQTQHYAQPHPHNERRREYNSYHKKFHSTQVH